MNALGCPLESEVRLLIDHANARHAEARVTGDFGAMRYWSERSDYWQQQLPERQYAEAAHG